jgi:zinc D-Ala-D-Ala carboxypeptidase
VLGLYFFQDTIRLKLLGYSNQSINKIKEYNLINYIIKKNGYSKTFDKALLSNNFVKNNKDIYYKLDYINNNNYIDNINDLITIGYKDLNLIFKNLDNKEIEQLKNTNYISNINDYLDYDYLIINNLNRYNNYKKSHPSLGLDTIITYVNIGLDKPQYSNINNIKNLDNKLILVNKYNKLASDYVPKDLVKINSKYSAKNIELQKDANDAFYKLCSDASKEGLDIKAISGYRSYSTQVSLYNNYVKRDGISKADTYSARAGHSEHQTGLAVDVSGSGIVWDEFANTKEYKWLITNAANYGFIIRYPLGKENITLYKYEPWHLRYVGIDIAKDIANKNLTYDEYYIRYLNK